MDDPVSIPGSIMVVDDKPANLKLLEKMLSDKGYRVRPFPKGQMALKAALIDPPDLILLDINMPDMDGFEVCERLKKDERSVHIPVIFISALSETLDKVKAFQAGGVDYVTKPFQFEEVYARVQTHLNLKRTRQMVEEKNRLLEKTLSDLQVAQKQLVQSEKMAALGVLTAGIAHEINNPVNFIKTSATGLSQDIEDIQKMLSFYDENCSVCNRDPDFRERLESVKRDIDFDVLVNELPELMHNLEEGVKRTQEIVMSLRIYSRMDDFEIKRIEIHTLIDASLVMLKNRIHKSIAVEKEYGSIPEIDGHPGKLIQVFTNILSNAVDALNEQAHANGSADNISKLSGDQERPGIMAGERYGNSGPKIKIKTMLKRLDEKDHIVINFQDNGTGVPSEISDKIFDPFFTTKEIGKGSGLGLSISMGIIREHNGAIEVESSPSTGTTFSVLLPVTEGNNGH